MKLLAATVAPYLLLVVTIKAIRHGNLRRLALFIALALRTTNGDAAPALPGEPCQVDPRPTWSETERWVWSRVCVGEIADLNAHFGGEPPEPGSPERWTDERKLSSTFLEAVLLHDPWRMATPRRGVRIVGAWIEKVDLNEAYVTQELWLEDSRFTSDVDLSGMRTTTLFSLHGSAITATLTMYEAHIGGSLLMREGAEFAEANLRGAQIGASSA